MAWWGEFCRRMGGLLRQRRMARELEEEIAFHVQAREESLRAEGVTEAQASQEARRRFGNRLRTHEQSVEAWGWRWIESTMQDVRFAGRMLVRRPVFSLIVIAVLALGIGLNAAMFSVVDAVLLRPLPYAHAEQLAIVWQSSPEHRATGEWFNSYRDFEEWQRHARSFDGLAAFSWATRGQTVKWQGKRWSVLAIPVSADFFSMLGVSAQHGRVFEPRDAGGGCAVVLSYKYWREQMGGDARVMGNTLSLGERACQIVGVMPKTFSFYPQGTQMWTVMTADSDFVRRPWETPAGVMVRLKPGISREAAEQELAGIQAGIASERPPQIVLPASVPVVLDMQREFTWLTGRNLRQGLLLLSVAVGLVLLIACVNVANLLLGRAAERQREMAIRAAIGCGALRMMRQLLTEALMLAGCGAAAGIGLAALALRAFQVLHPVELPPGNEAGMRWPVLGFVAVLAVLCTLVCGVAPAWRATRVQLSEGLGKRGSAPSMLRAGRVLVVVEVALSLVLMSGAALLTASLLRLAATPLGYRTDHLLMAEVKQDAARVDPQAQERTAEAILARASAVPGARGAALVSNVQPIGSDVLSVQGRRFDAQSAAHDVASQAISADYLRVAGVPLLAGRNVMPADRADTAPVALVSAQLAKEYFAAGDAIGHTIKLGAAEDGSAPWLTIVGIVGDVKSTSVFREMGYVTTPVVYRPMAQDPGKATTLLVRTEGEAASVPENVQRAVTDVDRDTVLADLRPVDDMLSEQNAQPRFRTALLCGFAGMAMLLAALGIYGLLAQRVMERTLEIGIRMALGSTRQRVVGQLAGEALRLVSAGVVLGGAGSLAAGRVMASLLYETRASDPWLLGAVTAGFAGVALAATAVPAWRASHVDPVVAMRAE